MADAPLYLGESLGFRAWHLDERGLQSLNRDHAWSPGENLADCKRAQRGRLRRVAEPHAHAEIPAEGCECGLFAYHSLDMAEYYGRMFGGSILGAVSCSGGISVYRHGFRAQRARVLALLVPPWGLSGDAARVVRERAEETSLAHGIPVFGSDRIPDFLAYCEAQETTAPLPESERPGRWGWTIARAASMLAWTAAALLSVLLLIHGFHGLSEAGVEPLFGERLGTAGFVALVIGSILFAALAVVKLLRRVEEMHFFNVLERIGRIDRSEPRLGIRAGRR
ncbi:MAG TPA: hypothetical protein VFN15_00185 [Solirubrobacterales bacterium]|nr:hypothetical protein [Solirubrobacterales bacterium]